MLALNNRQARMAFSAKVMQPIAIERVYRQAWPASKIIEIDVGTSEAERALDMVHGTDKLVISPFRSAITLAQRFRQAEAWENNQRDFTIRHAERNRYKATINDGGTIPAMYAFGYATATLDDFIRLYIVRFAEWFAYATDPATPKEYKPRPVHPKNGNEPFWAIPWSKIDAQRFIPFIYAQGMMGQSPIARRDEEQPALIQLRLDFH